MNRIKIERLAIWMKRILMVGFVLSVLAYIGFFIVPTGFGLQVVSAPSHDKADQTSLYYVKHVTPTDIRSGDVLIYIDDEGLTRTTTVSNSAVSATIPTDAGNVRYAQTLGVPKKEIQALGKFYQKNLTDAGRRNMVIFVAVVLVLNYLLSCLMPRKVAQSETSEPVKAKVKEDKAEDETVTETVSETATSITEDAVETATPLPTAEPDRVTRFAKFKAIIAKRQITRSKRGGKHDMR